MHFLIHINQSKNQATKKNKRQGLEKPRTEKAPMVWHLDKIYKKNIYMTLEFFEFQDQFVIDTFLIK